MVGVDRSTLGERPLYLKSRVIDPNGPRSDIKDERKNPLGHLADPRSTTKEGKAQIAEIRLIHPAGVFKRYSCFC